MRYSLRLVYSNLQPESRLFFVIPSIIASGIGLYGFGLGIDAGQGPIVTGMFYGFAIGGLLINMNTGFAYMLVAYRSISMETFVAATTFKNFMFFGSPISLTTGSPTMAQD